MDVLVLLDLRNTIPQTGDLNNRYFFTCSSGGWKTEVRVPVWSSSEEGSLSGLHLATFSLCAHLAFIWCRYLEKDLSLYLYQATNPMG